MRRSHWQFMEMSTPLFIAKLVSADSTRAVAELKGHRIPVSLALVPDAEVGDEVLVSHGFALRRMSEASEADVGSVGEGMDFPPGDLSARE